MTVKSKMMNCFTRLSLLIVVAVLASCAQYSVRSNKASEVVEKIDSVYVWAGIGSVSPFTAKKLFASDTFENYFNAALAKKFAEIGVRHELKKFSPTTDKEEDLARFERSFGPRYRLLIAVPSYKTITSQGVVNVDVLNLDVSLIRISNNKRIWQSEIIVDCRTAPGLAWAEDGARKLAGEIVGALRQDGLI